MSENNRLLVGIDLGETITQMTCFDRKIYEPVPVGRKKGEEREYEIHTALVVRPDSGEWFWADGTEEPEHGVLLQNLLDKVIQGDTFEQDGYTFHSREVLKRFLVKLLSLLKEYFPDETILRLVITVEDKERRLTETIRSVCEELGIQKERLVVQNHRQSYMYYAVSQAKELWMNNVGLFEYNQKGLSYSQINIDRRVTPWIVGVTKKDLSDVLDYSMLQDSDIDMGYAFVNVAGTVLHKQMVTTVYVTGKGFEEPWANEALKELCSGRRVFRGQNMFTKGACYAARELSGQGKLDQCLFLDEDMISANISIRTYHEAKMQEVLLAKAGTLWSEVDSSVDVIPDDEEEIQITAQDVLRHETKAHMLSLSGFAGRENKMTRFTIRIRFADRETCIVTLKDNGFGEYCPSSNRIWERSIKV